MPSPEIDVISQKNCPILAQKPFEESAEVPGQSLVKYAAPEAIRNIMHDINMRALY